MDDLPWWEQIQLGQGSIPAESSAVVACSATKTNDTDGCLAVSGFLSTPIQSKLYQRKGNETYRCGSADMQGYRVNMEDSHTVCMQLEGHPDIALFGVYDGHGGDQASAFIAKKLPLIIGKLPDPTDHAAITRAMIQMDLDFLKPGNAQREHGSTCVFVLSQKTVSCIASLSPVARAAIGSDHRAGCRNIYVLTVVNVGDSRAILLGADGTCCSMTKDHKPQDEEERKRIYAAGGCVRLDRVDGSLGLSRAIGDWNFKKNPSLSVAQQKVIPIPTITTHIAYEGDRILVCCDGLFEHMSDEDVANFAHAGLLKSDDPAEVMGQLVAQSLARGSKDNMTALIAEISNGNACYTKPDQFVAGPFHEHAHEKRFHAAYLADAKSRGFEGVLPPGNAHNDAEPRVFMAARKSCRRLLCAFCESGGTGQCD